MLQLLGQSPMLQLLGQSPMKLLGQSPMLQLLGQSPMKLLGQSPMLQLLGLVLVLPLPTVHCGSAWGGGWGQGVNPCVPVILALCTSDPRPVQASRRRPLGAQKPSVAATLDCRATPLQGPHPLSPQRL